MNEWLKLMLDEIRRKKREREAAARERERRASGTPPEGTRPTDPPGAR